MEARSQIVARMYVVLTVLCALPVLVAIKVVGIHVTDGPSLREQGTEQSRSIHVLPAVRGNILDAKGRTLVANTSRHDLAVDPTFGNFEDHAEAFLQQLAAVTDQSVQDLARRLTRASHGSKYVSLARDLTELQRARIDSWDYPFVILHSTFDRKYNHRQTMAHVLGHVNADGTGAAGIELQYDKYLRGIDGSRERLRDMRGQTHAAVTGSFIPPRHGESLVTTIDLDLQAIVEEALADGVAQSDAKWGVAVAMDPRTGAILAMSNVPTYDPNRPGSFPESARRNRAVADQFEPGSTFKLVSAIAAVETRTAALTDEVDTGKGYWRFRGRELRDTHANGVVTLAKAIELSSNIGIAKFVDKLPEKKLYEYARNLGFGQRTYIDLPGEASGLLKKPQRWSGTSKESISIGYEVAVTPLQIASAYAAFANGGRLHQPYVVAERRDISGNVTWRARPDSVRSAFKRKTAEKLLSAFEAVVVDGTAKKARVSGVRIAGKTGTAKKIVGGKYATGVTRASFAGFFPADDPQVVLVVMIDEPQTAQHGGDVAAPVFKRIVEGWLPTLPELRDTPAAVVHLADTISAPLPSVDGAPLAVARGLLTTAGLAVAAPAKAADMQKVEAVEVRERSDDLRIAAVRLDETAADPDEEVMPNLKGLGARQAVYWLQANNINDVKVEGRGRVVSQIPAPGHSLTGEVRLVCR